MSVTIPNSSRSHSSLARMKMLEIHWKNSLAISYKTDSISYFPISVIKHHDHDYLQKKNFTLIYSSRTFKPIMTAKAWKPDHQLRAHSLSHEKEAERDWKWPTSWSFPCCSDILPPGKSYLRGLQKHCLG